MSGVAARARTADARATAIGGIAILLWSSLALLTASAGTIPPFELLALTFAVAFAASLVPIARSGRAALRQPLGAWALTFGGLFLYHALYYVALQSAPPAEASLIAYLWPLLIVLFSAFGAGLRARHLIGAALGLTGTALLVLRRGEDGSAEIPVLGYAAAAGCAVVWSGYSVLNRRFSAVPSTFVGVVCGLVALAGSVVHLAAEPTVTPDAAQWASIVALGLGPVGLAFFAWDHGTKHGSLPVLGALSYLAPLASTLLLIAAGRAEARLEVLAAAGLTIAGAVVATRGPAARAE